MAIPKDLKERARMTRKDGVFTLKLDEGVSLAILVSFAQDMFPGVSIEDIGIRPADDGELVVSVRAGEQLHRNERARLRLRSPAIGWGPPSSLATTTSNAAVGL
jgi:hypothetical protein